ncbi:MAG: oxidoreductase [Nitratireductor sp.]|nr:oxidoreductase [Nitratireductor sp.]
MTGGSGFVGQHLTGSLRRICGRSVDIISTSRQAPGSSEENVQLDVRDKTSIDAVIKTYQPDHVIHLAAIAAPSEAQRDAANAWEVNLHGTLAVAASLLEFAPSCHLINVGSGLAYGESAANGQPIDENGLLAPIDIYGSTKAAADLALNTFVKQGLKCTRFRPFNHTGPGQTADFVVSAFATQIARIEAEKAAPIIRVGNLEAKRDFLDVRDVVSAYALAVQHADRLDSGVIMNVASGSATAISDILGHLLSLSKVSIRVETAPEKFRPTDLPCMIGDASKCKELLGWVAKIPLAQSIEDVLNSCRMQLTKPQNET